jgi:hypothetical protein
MGKDGSILQAEDRATGSISLPLKKLTENIRFKNKNKKYHVNQHERKC